MTKSYIEKLLFAHNKTITPKNNLIFEAFINDSEIINAVETILNQQKQIMANWQIRESIHDIISASIQIPNGTVGKVYDYAFANENALWNNMLHFEMEGLENVGLQFDPIEKRIFGTPNNNGDFKITLKFRVNGELENSILNEKTINLIINADPKSLWQNKASDHTDPFWKEDNVTSFEKIGDKNIVVASKRGRSHANVGSFRDDDFAFHHFEKNNWSVVAVSDGAGSAKYSRKGSEIACNEVINFFEIHFTEAPLNDFDLLLKEYAKENNLVKELINTEAIPQEQPIQEQETASNKTSNQIAISKFIYHYLGGCAKHVFNKLDDFANKNGFEIKDLHSTLIFTLFKKYDFGYVLLSFGVGDCPIAVINKDFSDFKLMNWLDVGDYGGGTRFITMPEIFTNDKFSSRFGFKIFDDFSYLMLMTDGIYDAKFVVEANLEKLDKWKEFIADLNGKNEEQAKVIFDATHPDLAHQLSNWMDFWSPGNHDDRTLAVIF